MKHKAVRINDLMYKGCEPHWKCIHCGDCVPFHCWPKADYEQMECKGKPSDNQKSGNAKEKDNEQSFNNAC